MDLSKLEDTVHNLYQAGLAPSTIKAYASGKRRYLDFCKRLVASPLPASEQQLCYFVAFLSEEDLKHQTIKSYLSAVRHLQISHGMGELNMGAMPRLELVVRGLKRRQASLQTKPRLPITPSILLKIRTAWDGSSEWDKIMLWAAMCICFFGFLRCGEVVVPGELNFDPSQHLTFADIAVDNVSHPTFMKVGIKQSKTDPFRKGTEIIIGRTGGALCPVAATLSYMVLRGPGSGPFFMFRDGRPLTRQRFVTALRDILQQVGIDSSKYSGHSFRIGAATTAAARGIQDSLIKTMGRWESAAYQLYVRTPQAQLVAVSATLALAP